MKILPLLTLKRHILTDDHCFTMFLGDKRIWTFQTFSYFWNPWSKPRKSVISC